MQDLIFVKIGNSFTNLFHVDHNIKLGRIEVELKQAIEKFATIKAEILLSISQQEYKSNEFSCEHKEMTTKLAINWYYSSRSHIGRVGTLNLARLIYEPPSVGY